jgi:type III pantothenate kinase
MLLTVDIGNTNIVIGVYPQPDRQQETPIQPPASPLASWRLSTDRQRTGDEYRLVLRHLCQEQGIDPQDLMAALVSVVAPLTDAWVRLLRDLLGRAPLVVDHRLDLGLKLNVERPESVGTDRLVDAVAGYRRAGGPAIVVDFGTATTFNVVTGEGIFLGGALAPGLGTVTTALIERASALPAVELVPPATAINSSTIPALQSGLIYGYVGLVEGLLNRIQAELEEPARVFATGGLGHIIAPLTGTIHEYDPWLTLAGLYEVYRLNPRKR